VVVVVVVVVRYEDRRCGERSELHEIFCCFGVLFWNRDVNTGGTEKSFV